MGFLGSCFKLNTLISRDGNWISAMEIVCVDFEKMQMIIGHRLLGNLLIARVGLLFIGRSFPCVTRSRLYGAIKKIQRVTINDATPSTSWNTRHVRRKFITVRIA